MKKKVLSLCLVLALLALAVAGATLAYFTDTDEVDNVFTVGNIDIEIVESQYHMIVDNKDADAIIADGETYQDEYLAVEGENIVPGKWVRKVPYINNIGANDAYVRIIVTQSEWFWNNTSMMEYTTAIENGDLVVSDPIYNNDGTISLVYTIVEPVKAGELSEVFPFWQFKINDNVTSEALEAANFDITQVVNVKAEAIQAETFDNYVDAFAAFDAQ